MSCIKSVTQIVRAGSLLGLSVLFGFAGLMKLAFVAGKAPADFAHMASKLYPIVVKTPLVRVFGLSANQFVLLLGVFEILAALACFACQKSAGIMVVAVMIGAEYVSWVERANPAMPLHPMCGGVSSTCNQVRIFHAVIVLMAIFAYTAGAPVCSSCCKVFGLCNKKATAEVAPESAAVSRPRRAAAMKKKDQ